MSTSSAGKSHSSSAVSSKKGDDTKTNGCSGISSPTVSMPTPPADVPAFDDGSRLLRGESFALDCDRKPRATTEQRKRALMLSTLSAVNVRKALAEEKMLTGGASGDTGVDRDTTKLKGGNVEDIKGEGKQTPQKGVRPDSKDTVLKKTGAKRAAAGDDGYSRAEDEARPQSESLGHSQVKGRGQSKDKDTNGEKKEKESGSPAKKAPRAEATATANVPVSGAVSPTVAPAKVGEEGKQTAVPATSHSNVGSTATYNKMASVLTSSAIADPSTHYRVMQAQLALQQGQQHRQNPTTATAAQSSSSSFPAAEVVLGAYHNTTSTASSPLTEDTPSVSGASAKKRPRDEVVGGVSGGFSEGSADDHAPHAHADTADTMGSEGSPLSPTTHCQVTVTGMRNPSKKQILALRRAPTMALRGPHLLPPRDHEVEIAQEAAALAASEVLRQTAGHQPSSSPRPKVAAPAAVSASVAKSSPIPEKDDGDGANKQLEEGPLTSSTSSGSLVHHSNITKTPPPSPFVDPNTAGALTPTATTVSRPMLSTQRLYTIVLDLDETVVYARDGPLYARSHLRELLLCMHAYAEVVVWTAGEREYAKAVLEEINTDHVIQHLIYRHKKWFNAEDYTKDLKLLGRDLRYVLIIENTPDCVRANPMNGIIVEDFEPKNVAEDKAEAAAVAEKEKKDKENEKESAKVKGKEKEKGAAAAAQTPPATKVSTQQLDHTFRKLITLVTDLGNSNNTPVPTFLSTYPLLRRQKVMGSNGEMIPIFYLSSRRARRVNTTAPQSQTLTPVTAAASACALSQGSADAGDDRTSQLDEGPSADTVEFKVAKGGGGKVVKVNRDKKHNSQ